MWWWVNLSKCILRDIFETFHYLVSRPHLETPVSPKCGFPFLRLGCIMSVERYCSSVLFISPWDPWQNKFWATKTKALWYCYDDCFLLWSEPDTIHLQVSSFDHPGLTALSHSEISYKYHQEIVKFSSLVPSQLKFATGLYVILWNGWSNISSTCCSKRLVKYVFPDQEGDMTILQSVLNMRSITLDFSRWLYIQLHWTYFNLSVKNENRVPSPRIFNDKILPASTKA